MARVIATGLSYFKKGIVMPKYIEEKTTQEIFETLDRMCDSIVRLCDQLHTGNLSHHKTQISQYANELMRDHIDELKKRKCNGQKKG